MKMVWPIATATYAPILDLVETTMKPMPSARMGMVEFYIALGTASHNGPTFYTSRGEYKHDGRRGRNFAAVKQKGYVVHYQKDGTLTPFANGFRMHNGIARDENGNLWCGDNQGDWRGGSPVYRVKKDGFHGHPSSLVWDERYEPFGMPLFYPRKLLDEIYDKPAMELPRIMMHSPGEPMMIQSNDFGPFRTDAGT